MRGSAVGTLRKATTERGAVDRPRNSLWGPTSSVLFGICYISAPMTPNE
jgi:hypothetical protein